MINEQKEELSHSIALHCHGVVLFWIWAGSPFFFGLASIRLGRVFRRDDTQYLRVQLIPFDWSSFEWISY
jgi:hypothetical protein